MLEVKHEMDALIAGIRAQVVRELLEQMERGFELEKIQAEAVEQEQSYLDGLEDGFLLVQRLLNS